MGGAAASGTRSSGRFHASRYGSAADGSPKPSESSNLPPPGRGAGGREREHGLGSFDPTACGDGGVCVCGGGATLHSCCWRRAASRAPHAATMLCIPDYYALRVVRSPTISLSACARASFQIGNVVSSREGGGARRLPRGFFAGAACAARGVFGSDMHYSLLKRAPGFHFVSGAVAYV